MANIEIRFIEDVEDFKQFTEENKQTYHLPIKDAAQFLKTGKAVRHFPKRGCGCKGGK